MPLLFLPIKSIGNAKLSDFEKSFVDWLNNCIATLNNFHSLKFADLDEIPKQLEAQTKERIKLTEWLIRPENHEKIKKTQNYLNHQAELEKVFALPYLRFVYLQANEIATVHEVLSLVVSAYENNIHQIHHKIIRDKINELRDALTACVSYMKASLVLPVEKSEVVEDKKEQDSDLDISIIFVENKTVKSRDPLTEVILPALTGFITFSQGVKADSDDLVLPQIPNPLLEEMQHLQQNTAHYFIKAIQKTTTGEEWLDENKIDYLPILKQTEQKSLFEKSKAFPGYASGLIGAWWSGKNKKNEKKQSIQNGVFDNVIEWLGDNYYVDRATFQYFSKWSHERYKEKLSTHRQNQENKRDQQADKYHLMKWHLLRQAICSNNLIALKEWLSYQKELENQFQDFRFDEFINKEVNHLTLLHWAYAFERKEMIAILENEFGAKEINTKRGTPKQYAEQQNTHQWQIELGQLIEAGDAVNVKEFIEQLQEIFKFNGDALRLDFENEQGFTPLLIAAINGNKAVYDVLCIAGADQELHNRYGMKPTDYAEMNFFSASNELIQNPVAQEQPTLLGRCLQSLSNMVAKVSPYGSPIAEKKEVVTAASEDKKEIEKLKQANLQLQAGNKNLVEQNEKLNKNHQDLVDCNSFLRKTTVINSDEKSELLNAFIENNISFDDIQKMLTMFEQLDEAQIRLKNYVDAYVQQTKTKSQLERLSFWVRGEGWHGIDGCERAEHHFDEYTKIMAAKILAIKNHIISGHHFDAQAIMSSYNEGIQFILQQVEKYVVREEGNLHQSSYKSYLLAYRDEIQTLIPAADAREVNYKNLENGEISLLSKETLAKKYLEIKLAKQNRWEERFVERANTLLRT